MTKNYHPAVIISEMCKGGVMRGTYVGNVKKHINCDVNGKIIGDVHGNINGNMNGEIRGNVFGTISRNVNGKIMGDIMRKSNIVGDINGQIEGNILGKQSEKKLRDLGGWGITSHHVHTYSK